MKITEVNNYKDYKQYISEIVDILVEEATEYNDGKVTHRDVSQSIQSTKPQTYYGYSTIVLDNSDKKPEEWKHMVDEDDYYQSVLQAMCYDILRQDIWEELHNRDIDIE